MEGLLVAVERGVMPANIVMEIARSPDGDVQRTLAEACENKLLPGNQVLATGGSSCSAVSAARSPTEVVASPTPERLPRRR